MKAVLVLDMPNSCSECPLNSHTEFDFDVCWVTQGKGGCPLKPMPNKRVPDGSETDQIYGCYVGWNACIDEIMGVTK